LNLASVFFVFALRLLQDSLIRVKIIRFYRKKCKNFGDLISWMISSTDTFEDKSFIRIPQENKRKKRKIYEKTFVKKIRSRKIKEIFQHMSPLQTNRFNRIERTYSFRMS